MATDTSKKKAGGSHRESVAEESLSDFNVSPVLNTHIQTVVKHFSSNRSNFASLVSSIGLNFDVNDSVFIDAHALQDSAFPCW